MESSLRKQLEMDDDDYWNQSSKFKRIFDDDEPSKKSRNLFDDDDDDDTGKRSFLFVGVKYPKERFRPSGFYWHHTKRHFGCDFHPFTANARRKHYIIVSL